MVLVVPVAESDSIRGINIICQADGGDCNEDIGTLRDLERCLELIWPVAHKKKHQTRFVGSKCHGNTVADGAPPGPHWMRTYSAHLCHITAS